MATTKFYLKPANSKNEFPVMLCYQDRGKKFRYFTKLFVKKRNLQNNRIKPSGLEDYEINEKLKGFEDIINNILKEGIENGVSYTVEGVETRFRNIVNQNNSSCICKGNPDKKNAFFDHFDEFVERSKATKSKATISGYKLCKKNLQSFAKEFGVIMSFEMINAKFYDDFQNYLISKKGFLNNTVGNRVKNLKVFLNYAIRNELTDRKLNFKDFKTINEEVDIVTLTEEELFRIFRCDNLSKSEQIARDYLCFECFTGLRFSDIGKLLNENIKEDFIIVKTRKTKDSLMIPLNIFAKEILDKYVGKYPGRPLPPPFANQVINRLIKDVAEKANINDITMIEKFNGANRITLSKPKYNFISTHTGRRTFITLSFEKGMQAEMIMKITGIKKWETLKRYLKVSEKSKLIKMNEFWNYQVMQKAVNYDNFKTR